MLSGAPRRTIRQRCSVARSRNIPTLFPRPMQLQGVLLRNAYCAPLRRGTDVSSPSPGRTTVRGIRRSREFPAAAWRGPNPPRCFGSARLGNRGPRLVRGAPLNMIQGEVSASDGTGNNLARVTVRLMSESDRHTLRSTRVPALLENTPLSVLPGWHESCTYKP
jgi:hypothetical protein